MGGRREAYAVVMTLALEIVFLVVTLATAAVVVGLFVWGAIKDGEDNDAAQRRVIRRRWPAQDR